MNRFRAMMAVGALVAVPLLSACEPEQVGSAAVVGGERIRVSQLQDLTQNLLDAGGGASLQQGEAQRLTLSRLIVSDVIAQAAADQDLVVTDRQVEDRTAQLAQQFGGEEEMRKQLVEQGNIPPGYIDQFIRDQVTIEALDAKLVPGSDSDPAVAQQRADERGRLLVETGKELGVTVSPRYGTWDPNTGSINGGVSGGLSQTAEELRAAQD